MLVRSLTQRFVATLLVTLGVLCVSATSAAQQTGTTDPIITTVRRLAPDPGGQGIAQDRRLAAMFTWLIDERTVGMNSIRVSTGGVQLDADYSLSLNKRVIFVDFPAFLPAESEIQVEIDGAFLKDVSGRFVDPDNDGAPGGLLSYSFFTGAPVDPPILEDVGLIIGNVYELVEVRPGQFAELPLQDVVVDSVYYPSDEGETGLPVPDGITDSSGYFEYTTVPIVGEAEFLVRVRKPGFSEALRQVTLMADRCWRIEDAVLVPLSPPEPVTVASGATLEDPDQIVWLDIPPNALQQDSVVGVTVLDDASLIRDELPTLVAEYGTFTDVAGVFGDATNEPVTYRVPNQFGLNIGERVPMGKIDHNTLEWMDLREAYDGPPPIPDEYLGEVKSDGNGGSYIEIQFDHFCTVCTGYCLPLPTPGLGSGAGSGTGGGPPCGGSSAENSTVGLRDGHLWEEVPFPSFQEYGETFGLTLSYYTGGALPSASISGVVDYQSNRPILRNIFQFQVEAQTIVGVYASSTNNAKPNANYIWRGENGIGEIVPTGSYPFRMLFTSLNENVNVAVPNDFGGEWAQQFGAQYPGIVTLDSEEMEGRVTILNLRDSEYGAGWRLLEEDRIYFDPDGCIILLSGQSQWTRFEPDPNDPYSWISPEQDFTTILLNPATGEVVRRDLRGHEQVYSSTGRILRSTDRYGNTTTFSRTNDLLTRITSPTGFFYDLFYDGFDKLMRVDDSAGRSTQVTVQMTDVPGGIGDLTSMVDAVGSTRSFEYDVEHLMTAQNGARGERTEYDYSNTRVVEVRAYDVDGTTLLRRRTFAPSVLQGEVGLSLSQGMGTFDDPIPLVEERMDFVTDGNGGAELHVSDLDGRTLYREDALGRRTTYTYNPQDLVATMRRPNGWTSHYEYDQGVMTTVREFNNTSLYSTQTQELNGEFHQASRIVDPAGKQVEYFYDSNGSLTLMRDHLGRETHLEYDLARFPQLPIAVESPGRARMEFAYDVHGNLKRITEFSDPANQPAGNSTRFTRDDSGNLLEIEDQEQRVTQYEYDAWSRVTKRVHFDTSEVLYSYDEQGCSCATSQLTKVTFDNNETLEFVYDGLGRIISEVDQFGRARSFSYDAEGNLIQEVDRKGDAIVYEYDAANQLVRETRPGPEIHLLEYDSNGLTTKLVEGDSTVEFTRDFLGRVTREDVEFEFGRLGTVVVPTVTSMNYSYDFVGNRTWAYNDLGTTNLTYGYDDLHRPLSILDNANSAWSWNFDYDANGRRREVDRGAQSFLTTHSYDLGGEVTSIGNQTTPSLAVDYLEFDGIGNVLTHELSVGGQVSTSNLVYDDRSRLATVTSSRSHGEATPDFVSQFDSANRVTTDGEYDYEFDFEGRMTRRTDLGTGVAQDFSWGSTGELLGVKEIVDPSGAATEVLNVRYRYDPLGRRIGKDVNGVITKYLYDGFNLLAELDAQDRVVRHYTHEQTLDHPLTVTDEVTGERMHILRDRLGSVVGLADQSGNLVKTCEYDEFGNRVVDSDPSLVQAYGFTGRELDRETGLYFFRARQYDPASGRFISEDPLGLTSGDLSFFVYAINNPANLIDPLGLTAANPALCACGAGPNPICLGAIAVTAVGIGAIIISSQNAGDATGESSSEASERQADYEKYKRFCDRPPGPGRNQCSTLSNQINHAKKCIQLIQAFDNKWAPGRHDQKIRDWTNRLNNLKKDHKKQCTGSGS